MINTCAMESELSKRSEMKKGLNKWADSSKERTNSGEAAAPRRLSAAIAAIFASGASELPLAARPKQCARGWIQGTGARDHCQCVTLFRVPSQVTKERAWNSSRFHVSRLRMPSRTPTAFRISSSPMNSGVMPNRMMSGARKSPMTLALINARMQA